MYILVKGECVVVIDGKEVRWQLACRLLSISKLFAECLELHRFVYFCSNAHRFTGGTVVPRTFGHMLSPNTQVVFAMASGSQG